MKQLLRRLRYLLNRRRFDRELADDMEFHREMAGGSGAAFGSTLRLREEAREAWGWTWLDRLWHDLRYAVRMLRKSPGFTVTAVLMLAIGIGVNVAAFGFFDLMVLRPLPVRDPATLVRFHRRAPQAYAFALPYPEMDFFRVHSRTLAAVLALNITKVAIEGEEKQINAQFVTANFFRELGATAYLGRMLDLARDEPASADPVVVLGHGFWQRHFGSDPLIVGKIIRLNDKPATVIGVGRAEFSGLSLDEPDLWAPLIQQPYFARGSHLLTDFSVNSSGVRMWGRLQPGFSPKAAEQELGSLAVQLRKQRPGDIWEKESIPSEPGGYAKSLRIGDRRGTGREDNNEMYPVFAMIGALCVLILSVACGNLGSLLLARGVARQREISIRVSVGAGSGRLIRQLLTESLLLAVLGAAGGLVLGYIVLRSLMVWTATPAWLNPMPDWRVALFAIGVGFAATILFGLTPALQLARQRHRATFTRQILIGAQAAASCVLLIVAGLLVRALDHATSVPQGFAYAQVISIDPGLVRHGYSPEKARTYLDVLQNRLRALPGVETVSLVLGSPLGNMSIGAEITVDGRQVNIQINHVEPEFFRTMRIPLLLGRNLTRGDTHAIVISDSMARAAWPGKDALGRKFTMDADYTVVGIAGNARLTDLQDSDSVEVYFPVEAGDLPSLSVLVKTVGPPENIAGRAASIAKSIDNRVFPEVQLMRNMFRQKLHGAEYSALSVSLLGVVALLLTCIGVVGLVAYAVSQHTKEIGIRMALGAKPSDVLAVVLRQFSHPVAVGLVVGVSGAALLSELLRRVLYGISHLDPAAYLAAIALFVVTISLAALLPARRALRVDPMLALRYD
ncbi:MAG: ABC transporter permease [Acidobacteriota bacterium]|nr:ABC transporter permease [Acidobacteriota bacterium]